MILISESDFWVRMTEVLAPVIVKSVSGPGRSGAIAAVYASHYLGVPMIPAMMREVPRKLRPLLVIDTTAQSGRTLRSLARRMNADQMISIFREPPRLRFWYEEEGRPVRDRALTMKENLPVVLARLRNTMREAALAPAGRREESMGSVIGETSKAFEWLGIAEPTEDRFPFPWAGRMTREELFAAARRLDGKDDR